MGESATDVVAEIERIRRRMDADVDELRTKLPEPKRLLAVAGGGLAALVVLRWLVRRSTRGALVPIAAGLAAGYVLAKRTGAAPKG